MTIHAAPPDLSHAPAAAPPSRSCFAVQGWVAAMGAFGVAIAAVPWVSKEFFNWVAFGSTAEPASFSAEARDYLRFNQALMGALTVGLAVALWWLVSIPLRRAETWAWWAIVNAVAAWFVIDCTASLATGYPRNVALNAVLVAPAVPLLWTARPGRARTISAAG